MRRGAPTAPVSSNPVMPEPNLGGRWRRDFDPGRFIAYYLYFWGLVTIGSMIAEPAILRYVNCGLLIPVACLFWGTRALKRHSQTARKWTVAIANWRRRRSGLRCSSLVPRVR